MNDVYIGYSACIFHIFMNFAQILYFFDFSKYKFKYDEISPSKIFCNYIFSFFWHYFGDIYYYDPIKITNLIGLYTFLLFILLYLYDEIRKDIKDVILNIIILFLFSFSFYHYFTYIVGDPNIHGIYSTIFSIIFFIVDNIGLYIIIQEDNNNHKIILLIIISFITSLLWYKYGEINNDFYIKLSFGLAAINELIKMAIFLLYYYKIIKRKYKGINGIVAKTDDHDKDRHIDYDFNEEKEKIKSQK